MQYFCQQATPIKRKQRSLKIKNTQENDKKIKSDIHCMDKKEPCNDGILSCKECQKLSALAKPDRNAGGKFTFRRKVSGLNQ